MYDLFTFRDKLHTGEISIDIGSHRINDRDRVRETLVERLDDGIAICREWVDTPPEKDVNKGWGAQALERMAQPGYVRPGRTIFELSNEFYCFNCGRRLRPMLREDGVIGLASFQPGAKIGQGTYVYDDCYFKEGVKPHSVRIAVPSGRLLFANYFTEFEDTPEGKKCDSAYSLESRQGRFNIADHLAAANVGCQQTGNMTVHVCQHRDSGELAVCRWSPAQAAECLAELDGGDTAEAEKAAQLRRSLEAMAGYEEVGSISCGVWRWMCVDRDFIPELAVVSRMDYVDVAVAPGTWEITDYHNSDERGDSPFMATLRRV